MEEQAKITSKGQITVPLAISGFSELEPETWCYLESDDDGVRVRPLRTESPFTKYRGIGTPGIGPGRKTIDRWVKKIRGR